MSNAKIFLVGKEKGETLIPMVETTYPTEKDVQVLLAQYWDLLPGDQIDPDNPRRWLFVSREVGVPGGMDEGAHWSLDHLFLDQDGIPTFVECKLAANPEVRRMVVAQMLEYAANGTAYWEVEELIEAAKKEAEKRNETLEHAVLQLVRKDDPAAVEQYWKDVGANLRAGRVRLIFVTEEAPRELRRLVEFLNEKMSPDVRLCIVEIKQFIREGESSGESQKALVSRAVGVTEGKPLIPSVITRSDFLAKCKPEARDFFAIMLDKAEAKHHFIYWGQTGFSVRAHLPGGGLGTFAYGFPSGEFQFYTGQGGLPLSDEQSTRLREELWNLGGFTKRAPKTLTAVVEAGNANKLAAVYDFILHKVDKILSESSEFNSSEVQQGY
jgi:hypothetical protein